MHHEHAGAQNLELWAVMGLHVGLENQMLILCESSKHF